MSHLNNSITIYFKGTYGGRDMKNQNLNIILTVVLFTSLYYGEVKNLGYVYTHTHTHPYPNVYVANPAMIITFNQEFSFT
jgi:hypothetical protein